ncbi:MAG TPA: DinB family protein [Anaerolineaceae bacterium]
MTLTVLLDLDDTLLNNDMQDFLPAYLKALGRHLSVKVPPEKMIPTLLAATEQMTAKSLPSGTLQETFDQHFYPKIGISKDELDPLIDDFYSNVFPGLQTVTSARPEAVPFVDGLFSQGYRVVIATNPLFPKKAIQHRLVWANVPVEKYPYTLITTYENLHFAKPQAAYLAEIVGQVGSWDDPVVMIGNSITEDYNPANELGIPFFLISNGTPGLPERSSQYNSSGTLTQAFNWVRQIEQENCMITTEKFSAVNAVLKSTPAVLDSLLGKCLPESTWKKYPAANEWSLVELMSHLSATETEVNLPRVKQILNENDPFLPGIDTDRWVKERNFQANQGEEVLKIFIEARQELLMKLNQLDPEAPSRSARHAIFGPTSLKEILGFIATHDRAHLKQVYNTLQIVR